MKGSQLEHLPRDIQHGIRLHRKIDKFTDNHIAVAEFRKAFPSNLRRMSGIVMDVYFDHLLCAHWRSFTPNASESLHGVLDAFYSEMDSVKLNVNTRFSQVRQRMLQHRWLADYQQHHAVIQTYTHIENRLNNRLSFADSADAFIAREKEQFEQVFLQLYPDLIRLVQHAVHVADYDSHVSNQSQS